MAIQMKRGKLSELDTSLLRSGEIIVATDKDYVAYVKNPPTDIVQLASKNDIISKGTAFEIRGKTLIFKQNRKQPTIKFANDFVMGDTYDVELGDARVTIEYALNEFLKCTKPKIISTFSYDTIADALKRIYKEAKQEIDSNEYVYIYCSCNDDNVSVTIYHGEPRQSSYIISNYSTDVRTGRKYYGLYSAVILDGEYTVYSISNTGEYTKRTQSTSYSMNRLGGSADASTFRVSNLGMTGDQVVNENDWEWDFSKCDVGIEYSYKRVYDLVDGLWCTLREGADIVNGQLCFTSGLPYAEIPYLLQLGRKVEIEFGECERYHSGTSYPSGIVFGNYISNSSQYGIDYNGLDFGSYTTQGSTPPRARLRKSSEVSDWVDLDNPNILSNNKIISEISNGIWQVKIVNSGGLSSVLEMAFNPTDILYSRVGRASQRSGTAYDGLYITRIKKITIN